MPFFPILSFCGGGVRGLMSALMLESLFNRKLDLLEKTSLFAGTSTGATIVSFLSAGQAPADIVDFFKQKEVPFFASQSTNADAPAYDNGGLIAKQVELHADQKLADLAYPVLFTAFDLGSPPGDGSPATPWSPKIFTNVDNPVFPTPDVSVVDAVVASGSMPGMLPSYKNLVDGAFVHHDPTLAAIAVLVGSGVPLDQIIAICFGTGFMENWIGSDTTQWGANQWLNGDGTGNYDLPGLLVNETETTPCPMLNLSLNGTSSTLIPNLCELLLPGRYVNLNPTLNEYVPENASQTQQIILLEAMATTWMGTEPWQKAEALLSLWPG